MTLSQTETDALRLNVKRCRGQREFEEEGLACDVEMLCEEVDELRDRGAYSLGREAVCRRLILWLRSEPRLPVDQFAVDCERDLATEIESALQRAKG